MTSHEIALTFSEKFQSEYPETSILTLMEDLRKTIDQHVEEQVKICWIADVVEPKGKLKCGNCGSIKLRKSLRNQKVYCLECKHSRAF